MSLSAHLRHAARMLRLNPGFAAVAILTLALGIGATTAMFTVVDGVVVKSLRYPDAERIVAVSTSWTDSGKISPRTTGGDIDDLRGVDETFEAFSYYYDWETGVQLNKAAAVVRTALTDPEFFRVFAVPAMAGRTFTEADAGRAAVVSVAFAERNFGSVSAALGQTLRIDQTAYEIVGVMPPVFQFPRRAEVWAAISPNPPIRSRSAYNYYSVAKLRRGGSPAMANAHLMTIGQHLATAFPDSNRNKTFIVVPLQQQLAAPVRTTLFILMGAVGLVLMIACANVANLMLARATARSREFAVRAALGAGRRQLIAHLLVESVGLSAAAGGLGLALAAWGTKALLDVGAQYVPAPLLADIKLDWRVLAFTVAASFATSILFGIAPALQVTRVDLQYALKQGGGRGPLGGGPSRLRDSLVIAQIALSLMLAIGAGLLFRTLLTLHSAELGYRTEATLVAYAHAPAKTTLDALEAGRFFDDVLIRLRQLPGVLSAAAVNGLPSGQGGSNGNYAVEGQNSFTGDTRNLPHADFNMTSPGYFATLGIPLVRGRDFNDTDLYDRPFVAIISESVARQIFPHDDPVGHRIMCGLDAPPKWMTIVGIVGDVRQDSPAAQPGPALYVPLRQHPFFSAEQALVMRTSGNPDALISAVQNAIRQMNPEIATKFTTMNDLVSDSISAQRFRTALVSSFAVLALLLALSGMYAVMSYVMTRRTSEFGLRSALGAQPGNIMGLVLKSAARLAIAGVIAGVVLSIFSGRLVSNMLFGIQTTDPKTYAAVIAVVFPIVLLAAALPAWRASRVDPVVALRSE
jgi:putative ABC transport system permease protein